ncbi:hypothetical protein SKAU_G00040170 [Synaphobranchus kaupii]|uniref:Uncharacterized protein n=1 Tax=Synaphobranchus kaupii TaxID=118154 RepID=A0A9Q1G1X0_SYNKA|nr:hypothetical protein SKAU_G00040170 [Synaphobranchus kaupii]
MGKTAPSGYGGPYDLEFREVCGNSLVLLWERPLYEGRSLVTGYLVELLEEGEAEEWTALTQEPITDTNLKVSSLTEGKAYRLRVSAVNDAGVGVPSLPTEPIIAQTKPGTKDMEIGVDDDGFIFLAFESQEGNEFTWAKNYKDNIDAGRATVETSDNRSTLTFSNASEEDLGLYTAAVTDCPEVSTSYDFTAEDLERMLELSWDVRNPLIALVTPWEVEVLEKGGVRFWLRTEPLTTAAELHLIFNDREISSTPARKINFDKATGLVEVLIEDLSQADEGSYTAQLRDGRAKNEFTLVFVDEKFRQTLAQARAKRNDWKRKMGPYFLDYLSWDVTENCEVVIKCKVTNLSKDTSLKWFKDGEEMKQFGYEQQTGVSSFTVAQMTEKDAGVYRATVSDSRGEDVSTLELVDKEFEKLQEQLCKQCALSASPLKIQSTAEGFKLYCSLKHYLSYMKTTWYLKEKRIDQETRIRTGSSMQKVWVEILGPTDNDKGKYTLEMFDGQETHKRTMDLSGQAFADAMLEYQRLKQAALAEKNRAKVTKGLPDVVAIMENKTLCLTCFAEGDPAPEMSWLKNDHDIATGKQYNVATEKQCTTLTINDVTVEDSGVYSLHVHNKHGSDTVYVTVSVYKHGELPRADAVELSAHVQPRSNFSIPLTITSSVGHFGAKEATVTTTVKMAFSGTWQVYAQENYEEFLRAISLPEDVIKVAKDVKPVTEIQQNGNDFVVTSKTPRQSVTNSFTIGKEADITTMDGKKLKCIVKMEGGKLICQTEKFTHIQEIKGDEMVESLTVGSTTLIRKSKKV